MNNTIYIERIGNIAVMRMIAMTMSDEEAGAHDSAEGVGVAG
jgi:hypothetical protein